MRCTGSRHDAASFILAGLLASTFLLSPHRAAAQSSIGSALARDVAPLAVGVLSVGYLTVSTILIAEAVAKIQQGYGLYTPGAVLELIWGSLAVFGGVALKVGGSLGARSRGQATFDLGAAAAFALGAHFLVHGVWSLTEGRRPAPQVWLGPQVSADGGGLLLGGTL